MKVMAGELTYAPVKFLKEVSGQGSIEGGAGLSRSIFVVFAFVRERMLQGVAIFAHVVMLCR